MRPLFSKWCSYGFSPSHFWFYFHNPVSLLSYWHLTSSFRHYQSPQLFSSLQLAQSAVLPSLLAGVILGCLLFSCVHWLCVLVVFQSHLLLLPSLHCCAHKPDSQGLCSSSHLQTARRNIACIGSFLPRVLGWMKSRFLSTLTKVCVLLVSFSAVFFSSPCSIGLQMYCAPLQVSLGACCSFSGNKKTWKTLLCWLNLNHLLVLEFWTLCFTCSLEVLLTCFRWHCSMWEECRGSAWGWQISFFSALSPMKQ
jgi:hypothetical protein